MLYRIGVLSHSLTLLACYLVYAKFSQNVAAELEKHIAVAREMFATTKELRAQLRVFEDVLESVRYRSRIGCLW